jgi:hypothetical protein
MNTNYETRVEWTPDMMLEVKLSEPDDFLKAKETLSRVGVLSKKDNTLYQSVHILHKKSKYYLVSFKELFLLDGKYNNLTINDIQRRNRIAYLLQDWGLVKIVEPDKFQDVCPMNQIKVIPYKEKNNFNLVSKYTIGKKPSKEVEEE